MKITLRNTINSHRYNYNPDDDVTLDTSGDYLSLIKVSVGGEEVAEVNINDLYSAVAAHKERHSIQLEENK